MGLPNSQLTTNFSAKRQLSRFFLEGGGLGGMGGLILS